MISFEANSRSDSTAEVFIREFVIGLGFLSGLWIYAGIDPEAVIIGAFVTILQQMGSPYGWLLWLLPIISTLVSIVAAWAMGGPIGILTVALAFFGGIFIGSIGIWLLIAGVLIAPFAVRDS